MGPNGLMNFTVDHPNFGTDSGDGKFVNITVAQYVYKKVLIYVFLP